MKKTDFIEADDYYDIACQWMKEKEWDKAISSLKHVIDLNNNFIYAYIDLAAAYAAQRDYHAAAAVLKKAIKSDPGFDLLHYNLAKYLYRNGEVVSALKSIEKAAELNNIDLYERVKSLMLKKLKEQKTG